MLISILLVLPLSFCVKLLMLMKLFRNHLFAAVALVSCLGLTACDSHAHEFTAGDLRLMHPSSRATPPGAKVAGGFVKIENKGATADKLLSASAAVSKSVELHSMSMDNGIMRMRQVEAIDLPAKSTVELKSGGLHIMFIDINAAFKEGEKFPLTLKFEKAGEVKVEVVIEKMGAGAHQHH